VELLQEMEGLDRGLLQEAAQTVSWLTNAIDGYELAKLLSGPYDKKSARLTISAGAGGTDAQVGLFTTSMIIPVSLSTTPELP
jgi:peptide chain release factor 2